MKTNISPSRPGAWLALSLGAATAACSAPAQLVAEKPGNISTVAPGVVLVDFGRVAYGNLRFTPPANATNTVTVRFGEAFANGRINQKPPGSVRYWRVQKTFTGEKSIVVAPPADARNTKPPAAALTPAEHRAGVTDFVAQRGMACSVYAAQYLMEGLFANDAGAKALALITAPNDRSWNHMVESGTTITWEAWDQKYKPNQDWNHAWGAAPASLLPRFVLGAQPLMPGWQRALIRPNPGSLKFAGGKIPTPRGPLLVSWKNESTFKLSLTLPPGVKAKVELPATENSRGVFRGDQSVSAHRAGSRWLLDKDVVGTVPLEVK